MKELKISGTDQVAIVDDEDYDRLSQYTWRLSGASKTIVSRQQKRCGWNKSTSLACEIMQKPSLMFDHIDRNFLNNQKENLRSCNTAQNAMNKTKTKNTSSVYKGVSRDRQYKKWRAMIRINGKLKNLGGFETEINAGIAYNCAAHKFFGEFAVFNPLPFVATL